MVTMSDVGEHYSLPISRIAAESQDGSACEGIRIRSDPTEISIICELSKCCALACMAGAATGQTSSESDTIPTSTTSWRDVRSISVLIVVCSGMEQAFLRSRDTAL